MRPEYAVKPRYYLTSTNFGMDDFAPLVVAGTPRGRILVGRDLRVFEEGEFEPDPPGLRGVELGRHREARAVGSPVLFRPDGMVRLRPAGSITAERR